MRLVLIAAATILLQPVAGVWAERCVGPRDTDALVTTTYNITPFSQSDIVFCDDFDSYCLTNYNTVPRVQWPGYPPDPDTTWCTSPTDGTETYIKQSYHWAKPYSGGPQFGLGNAAYGSGGLRLEGWNGNSGWTSLNYVVIQAGNNTDPIDGGAAYGVFDMTNAIAHRFPDSDAVNGTDAFPLILRFWLHCNNNISAPAGSRNWGQTANWPFYMELTLGSDRAPTDYAMSNPAIAECVNQQVNFPVICQQHPSHTKPPGLPSSCPPLSSTVHKSLAFGWLAPMDTNPCNVETGRKPTMYHAATFDGLYWSRLVAGQYPGNGGDFNYGMGLGFFEITIRSTEYDVRLIAPYDCTDDGCPDPPGYDIGTSIATIPRQYTGPFDHIGMGVGPACELDPVTGDCKAGKVRDQHAFHYGWGNVYPDRPVVFGGVGNSSTGACCFNDPQNPCQDLSAAACELAGGRFSGPNTTCAATICCPYPFADSDYDGDVDQDDFGAYQLCFTNTGGGVPTGCTCFNRDGDDDVDGFDLEAFNHCFSGANVPWVAGGSCNP